MTLTSSRPTHIAGLGNAIADTYVTWSHEIENTLGSQKGTMQLLSPSEWQKKATELGAIAPQFHAGGSVANATVWSRFLGAPSIFNGVIGDDQAGIDFHRELKEAGVDAYLRLINNESGSGKCLVCVCPRGERTMFTTLGASIHTGAAELDALNHLYTKRAQYPKNTKTANTPSHDEHANLTHKDKDEYPLLLLEGYVLASNNGQELIENLIKLNTEYAKKDLAGQGEQKKSTRLRVAVCLSDVNIAQHIQPLISKLCAHKMVHAIFGNSDEYWSLLDSEKTHDDSAFIGMLCQLAQDIEGPVVVTAGESGAMIFTAKKPSDLEHKHTPLSSQTLSHETPFKRDLDSLQSTPSSWQANTLKDRYAHLVKGHNNIYQQQKTSLQGEATQKNEDESKEIIFYTTGALNVTVTDTTGAGDAFTGAFLAGWTHGASWLECLKLGCLVAGTLSTFFAVRPDQNIHATIEKKLNDTGLSAFTPHLIKQDRP